MEIPTTHLLTPRARRCNALEGVHLRCTQRDCPLRPAGSQLQGIDPAGEISADHRAVDILAMLHAEAAEIAAEDPEVCDEEYDDDEGMEQDARKRDCLVDLWPFAQSVAFYEQVFPSARQVGCRERGCARVRDGSPGLSPCTSASTVGIIRQHKPAPSARPRACLGDRSQGAHAGFEADDWH